MMVRDERLARYVGVWSNVNVVATVSSRREARLQKRQLTSQPGGSKFAIETMNSASGAEG